MKTIEIHVPKEFLPNLDNAVEPGPIYPHVVEAITYLTQVWGCPKVVNVH